MFWILEIVRQIRGLSKKEAGANFARLVRFILAFSFHAEIDLRRGGAIAQEQNEASRVSSLRLVIE